MGCLKPYYLKVPMLTISTTSVTFSSEPIHGTDKKKVTLTLIVPHNSDQIMQTFHALNQFDIMLQGDALTDAQYSNGLGMECTNDKVSNIVTYKFIL